MPEQARVRELAFGPDEQYEKYLGIVFAAFEATGYRTRDELVAIDRLKATPAQWESVLRRRGAGARVPVHAFREGRLYEAVLELAPPALERVELALAPRPTAQQRKRLNSWLRLAAP